MHYLNIELLGNTIYERYVDDTGTTRTREIEYQPTLFHHVAPGITTDYRDIHENFVQPKKFFNVRDARNWIQRMKDVGQEALGMDDFAMAYVSDVYKGHIDFNRDNIRIGILDIEVTAPEFPDPKYARYEIDLICHCELYKGKRTYYIFDLISGVSNWQKHLAAKEVDQEILDNAVYFAFDNEKELLLNYLQFWRERTHDIVFGWNSEIFDIPYIVRRYENVLGPKAAKMLSPYNQIKSRVVETKYGEQLMYEIVGITTMDYMDVFKKFSFTTMPSYALGYVAERETGRGKLDYEGPINEFRGRDHQRYVDYCLIDVQRILDIDKKRCFIDLILSLSYYAKVKFKDVMGTVKVWDSIIFNSLRENKVVVPQMVHTPKQSFVGAFVKEPVVGRYYRYILSFDLTSLYPSIMRLVNISPETIAGNFNPAPLSDYIHRLAPRPSDEFSCAPNGMMYRKDKKGVLPRETKKVFDQRKAEKKMMMAAQRNREAVKKIMAARGETPNGEEMTMAVELWRDFNEAELEQLHRMSDDALHHVIYLCGMEEAKRNTNQLNRKILINSLYGAVGNEHFRFFNVRNAEAITTMGQLAIQWISRKLNEYLNNMIGSTGVDYVVYCDTDSTYICFDALIDKIGESRFRDTNHIVDFLDKLAKEKIEPYIDVSYRELEEYFNNTEHLLLMDREAIACPPLGSKGIGGFWTGKKRYALNVYDMEGVRYAEPKLKIMGMETQRSSTPLACQKSLKESIRRMLQEGEESLQEYYAQFSSDFYKLDYQEIAAVSSANNLMKWTDARGFPISKTPYHIKGAQAFNRIAAKYPTINPIKEGEKVMILALKDRNPFMEKCISWPSGTRLPPEIEAEVLKWVDYRLMFDKTYAAPIRSMCEANSLEYEKRNNLFDMFDI